MPYLLDSMACRIQTNESSRKEVSTMPLPGGGDGTRRGTMEDKKILREAINNHTEDMTPEELEMILRFIHSLKDFR